MRGFSVQVIALMSLLLSFSLAAKAGDFDWEWNPKYYGEYRAGYGTTNHVNGMNNYYGRAILGTIQGVRFNKYLQMGVGVDGIMMTHYYKGESLRWAMDAYADMRGFYPVNERFKLFIDLGLGAFTAFNVKTDNTSFFCQFGPGIQYRKFTLSTGLQHCGKKINTFYSTIGFTF